MPGVLGKDVADMEAALRSKSNDTRTQKEAVRDLLRRATLVAVSYLCPLCFGTGLHRTRREDVCRCGSSSRGSSSGQVLGLFAAQQCLTVFNRIIPTGAPPPTGFTDL